MVKSKRICRIYLYRDMSQDIVNSQIFNWGSLLQKENIDCFYLLMSKKSNPTLNSNMFTCKYSKNFLIRDLFLFIKLLKLSVKFKKYKKIILQTRVHSFVFPLIVVKNLYSKMYLIYESRAAGEDNSNSSAFLARLKAKFRRFKEKLILKYSDEVFVVSNYMKTFFIDEYPFIKKKISLAKVFPGAADSSTFFYDENLRKSKRLKLGIRDDVTVFVYSGSLRNSWNVPEKVFDFFSLVQSLKIKSYFIILSPDIKIASKLNTKYRLDKLLIDYVDYENLNDYYNASDVGILLREEKLLNLVSSPTKFSEYLSCGLSVIISSSVRDYSKFTLNNRLGLVLDDLDFNSKENFDKISGFLLEKDFLSKENKVNICRLAQKKLSKQNYVKLMANIYKDLL